MLREGEAAMPWQEIKARMDIITEKKVKCDIDNDVRGIRMTTGLDEMWVEMLKVDGTFIIR